MTHKVGIIGLGIVGRRTLANMTAHDGFEVVAAWDLSPEACALAAKEVKGLAVAEDAGGVLASEAELVYIATPPLHHDDYVLAAVEAGKAIFCEKPLGIDVERSRRLCARVEASGLANAVNFVFASAPGAVVLGERLRAGELGAVAGADIRLHFAVWPREWQAAAEWLKFRDQGGFVREVLSHFVFLVARLTGGPLAIAGSSVAYPGGGAAETAIAARLERDGTQVTIAGSTGGVGPDRVELTVWGARASYRLTDWYRLWRSEGGDWEEQLTELAAPRIEAYMAQLDDLAALLDGRPHSLPDFREALAVQELIEALLKEGAGR